MKTTERPKNNFDTTVFNELNFLSHPMGMGEQCIVQFPNGYGASIVKGEHTYGGKNGWNSANYLNIWVVPSIDKNKPIHFEDIIPYPLCIHDREKQGDPIKIEQQKEIEELKAKLN